MPSDKITVTNHLVFIFAILFIHFFSKHVLAICGSCHLCLSLTLCKPIGYSPPCSSVHENLQARILEWVAIPVSRGSSWPRDRIWVSVLQADSLPSEPSGKRNCTQLVAQTHDAGNRVPCSPHWKGQFSSVQSLSRVQLFVTPWIAARQASLSITNPQSSLRLTSIESVMPSSHLILCRPLLLLPPIPPSIRAF